MKKRIIACMFACAVALSFAVPVMAANVVAPEPVSVVIEQEQEITPFGELTRFYFRTYGGVLQARVWSITNGRWLTNWVVV